MNIISRRNRIDLHYPIEIAIREAMITVEEGPAHPLLTEVVNLLEQAKNKASDYYDSIIVDKK